MFTVYTIHMHLWTPVKYSLNFGSFIYVYLYVLRRLISENGINIMYGSILFIQIPPFLKVEEEVDPMMSFEVVVLERVALLVVVTHIQLSSFDNKMKYWSKSMHVWTITIRIGSCIKIKWYYIPFQPNDQMLK